jgi:hypothetical protein
MEPVTLSDFALPSCSLTNEICTREMGCLWNLVYTDCLSEQAKAPEILLGLLLY